MARGGKRPGAGRPKGSVNRMATRAREEAAKAGMLPHELLLAISRGEAIDGHVPSFAERVDAAKAAAPFYAPKLAAVDVNAQTENRHWILSENPMSADEWEAEYTVGAAAGTAEGAR